MRCPGKSSCLPVKLSGFLDCASLRFERRASFPPACRDCSSGGTSKGISAASATEADEAATQHTRSRAEPASGVHGRPRGTPLQLNHADVMSLQNCKVAARTRKG